MKLSAENICTAKRVYLTTYHVAGLLTSLFLIYKLAAEALGVSKPLVSSYSDNESNVRFVFRVSELLVLLEVINHLTGLQAIKRHIFIFTVWVMFVAFGVLSFYPTHFLVIYWVFIRSCRKALRYSHRLYLDYGRRHKSCKTLPIEWVCINLMAFSFPVEYFTSVLIILATYPVARHSSTLNLNLPGLPFTLDLSLYYFIMLAVSLPYFLGALVYVWRKRDKLAYLAAKDAAKAKRQKTQKVQSEKNEAIDGNHSD